MSTTPKGQINAPDQLDYMSTLLPDTSMAYMQGKVRSLQEALADCAKEHSKRLDEIEQLRTDKETLFNTLHSERKEYNALQDSTKFDEALLRGCLEVIDEHATWSVPVIQSVTKLKERLGL